MALFDSITREHVLQAIKEYDSGRRGKFGDARTWEIVYTGRRYPSKHILGLAATLATGEEFGASDFYGGLGTTVPILRRLGFVVIDKNAVEEDDWRITEEVDPELGYREGAAVQVLVNAYERNPAARKACIKHWGTSCVVCGFDFYLKYGEIGQGFIHVHHLRPMAQCNEEYDIDPVNDLRPVCPNCHAMLHRPRQVLSIEELQQIICDIGASKS